MLGSIEGVIEKPDTYPPTIKDGIYNFNLKEVNHLQTVCVLSARIDSSASGHSTNTFPKMPSTTNNTMVHGKCSLHALNIGLLYRVLPIFHSYFTFQGEHIYQLYTTIRHLLTIAEEVHGRIGKPALFTGKPQVL